MKRLDEIRERCEKAVYVIRETAIDTFGCDTVADSLADIPLLLAEVTRLTAERDAAVDDLKIACQIGEVCATCHWCCNCGDQFPCDKHYDWCGGASWKWRGAEGKEGATDVD